MTPISTTPASLRPDLGLSAVSAAGEISQEARLEEIFAQVEFERRNQIGASLMKYGTNIYTTVALSELPQETLNGIKDDLRPQIAVFYRDIQDRIKNILWRLDGKPDNEDPIEYGNRILTDDLVGTGIAIHLTGILQTENLDDAGIDTLIETVVADLAPILHI